MIDSHAHLAFYQFDADRDQVVGRLAEAGVTGWVEIGTDSEQSKKAVALAQHYDNCWSTVGVHPDDIATLTEETWHELEQLLAQPKVVAVGEVGFDFFRDGTLEQQRPVLERFIKLAIDQRLPIVFHVRDKPPRPVSPASEGGEQEGVDSAIKTPSQPSPSLGEGETNAHEALLSLLETYPASQRPRGVIHTFSGKPEQAQKYLELGLYLSFSGVVTFKNAGGIQDVARTMPLDRLLIETDCPFLTPEPHRGQRNDPSYVRLVAEKIASLRGISVEEVDQATEGNTRRLFSIKR